MLSNLGTLSGCLISAGRLIGKSFSSANASKRVGGPLTWSPRVEGQASASLAGSLES